MNRLPIAPDGVFFLLGDTVRFSPDGTEESAQGNVLTVDHVFQKEAYCVRGDPDDPDFEGHWYPMKNLVKVTGD